MTPDEHAAKAEEWLSLAEDTYQGVIIRIDAQDQPAADLANEIAEVGVMAQLAQVHATLSLGPA